MLPNILTKNQERVLAVIARDKSICKNFYLTGGTALAGFYLGHRYSEDLDFFSVKEVDPLGIDVFLKSHKMEFGFDSFDYQQSMNRNLYFLKYSKEDLKIEFTFFPFPQIEKPMMENGLPIDSLLDIAVNKTFTIYQRTVARDYIDLFMICKEKKFNLNDLIAKARIKFDWYIDQLQLGAQFFKVRDVSDLPRMITNLEPELWRNFFITESEKLKALILE